LGTREKKSLDPPLPPHASENSCANCVEMRKCVEEKDKKDEEFNCRCVKME
jgi:hypothetical protein